jgi:dihydroorotate dehydrogenase
MIYKKFVRPIFFKIDPEKVHTATLKTISIPPIKSLLNICCNYSPNDLKKRLFGIDFPNPIGLAAGFDKNAAHIDSFSALGFGFIEIGTVTPLAQEGNAKPRIFRFRTDSALINRMGFNNEGVGSAVENIKKCKAGTIIGGNIGKNKTTPNENAVDDYLKNFKALFNYVDYFVINVSSPNTPGLRALQEKEPLMHILNVLQKENYTMARPKPILLKIAPDLTNSQLDDIIEIVQKTKIDGIVATNTTISRNHIKSNKEIVEEIGAGGLSGKPLFKRSTEVIRYIKKKSSIPVIGVGGIHSAEDAIEKIKAGADLIQIYTGLIYEGPFLIKKIKKQLVKYYLNNRGVSNK